MKRRGRSVVSVGSLVCVLAPLTRAGPVTWQVTGVVTEIRDPYGELGGLVRVGDDLFATYTFISTTTDSLPHDPTLGRYDDAVQSITGSVGLIAFGSEHPFGHISVGNYFVAIGDYYSMGIGGLTTSTFDFPTEFLLDLQDPTGDIFFDDALLLEPPPLNAFVLRRFNLQVGSDRIVIQGQVTSLVPEPASLVLLGIGATAMLLRRRHRGGRGAVGAIAALLLAAPQLLMAQQWPSTSGPVLIGGDDADGHFGTPQYPTGKNYIRHGFTFFGAHVLNGKTLAVCIACNL